MEREEVAALAAGALKKILSGRGRLQGSFYYVCDSGAKEAVLVATLASKDKKGTRALNQGRPFRKEISGSRWARGSITFSDDGKMVFTIFKGTANKKAVTDGLRKVLCKGKGLSFLKRAVVTSATASREEQASDAGEVEAVDEADFKEADNEVTEEELAALESQQGTLDALNAAMRLSDEELEAEYAREVEVSLKRLSELQARDPLSTQDALAQAEAWGELAGLVAVGRDNPQLGEDLSPELAQVLQAATTLIDVGTTAPEDDAATLKARLLGRMQEAEQRYFAVGEPEEVRRWLLQAEALYKDGAHREGLALMDTEVEWRLVHAERNQEAQETATAGRVDDGRLVLLWRQAYDAAQQKLRLFQSTVISDKDVTADLSFEDMRPKIEALQALLPEPASLLAALDDYVSAGEDLRDVRRKEVVSELADYEAQLNDDVRLKELDDNAFGSFDVHKTLADAVQRVREHLTSAS